MAEPRDSRGRDRAAPRSSSSDEEAWLQKGANDDLIDLSDGEVQEDGSRPPKVGTSTNKGNSQDRGRKTSRKSPVPGQEGMLSSVTVQRDRRQRDPRNGSKIPADHSASPDKGAPQAILGSVKYSAKRRSGEERRQAAAQTEGSDQREQGTGGNKEAGNPGDTPLRDEPLASDLLAIPSGGGLKAYKIPKKTRKAQMAQMPPPQSTQPVSRTHPGGSAEQEVQSDSSLASSLSAEGDIGARESSSTASMRADAEEYRRHERSRFPVSCLDGSTVPELKEHLKQFMHVVSKLDKMRKVYVGQMKVATDIRAPGQDPPRYDYTGVPEELAQHNLVRLAGGHRSCR